MQAVGCILEAPSSFYYNQTVLELTIGEPFVLNADYIGAELVFAVKDADLGKALPEGLTIDATNGTIYGIPTIEQKLTAYTLLCRNTRGDLTFSIQIAIHFPVSELEMGDSRWLWINPNDLGCGFFGLVEQSGMYNAYAKTTTVKINQYWNETTPYELVYKYTEYKNKEYNYILKKKIEMMFLSAEDEKYTFMITAYNITLSDNAIEKYHCNNIVANTSISAE